MASTHSYDIDSDLGGLEDMSVLYDRAVINGPYTNPGLQHYGSDITVTIDEDSISFGDLKTALTTAPPSLSVDRTDFEVSPGGGTEDVVVSGPDGGTCTLECDGWMPVDALTKTMTGGSATFTFDCPSGQCWPNKRQVTVTSPDALRTSFLVSFK